MPCTVNNGIFTPPKFNIAPEKWWLEDDFPFGKAYLQGQTVKFPRCTTFDNCCKISSIIDPLAYQGALLSAYDRTSQWQQALHLLAQLPQRQVQADVVWAVNPVGASRYPGWDMGYLPMVVSNISLFSPLPGEMIQFGSYIFQMGWNHQLDIFRLFFLPGERRMVLCHDEPDVREYFLRL